MTILRQSTAVDVLIGPFVDSTDGDTEETGLTIAQADVRLSQNGQTAAQKNDATTCAHDADGFYNCELDATDTATVGTLVLYVHVAEALAVRHEFQIVEEAVYDALFAASAPGFATVAALATAQADLDTVTGSDGATLATAQANYAPAKAGDLMGLADDAITSAKYDESTAFALASADTGATAVARTGADGDTLETLSDEIATVDSNVDTLVSRITATLFAGVTSLAEWLGLIAGKQTGDATARTELRATGAGAGTFDETTDSQEALRDNQGTAQTGDAFGRLGAPAGASVSADIATRASQTSVDDVPTTADLTTALGTADDAVLAAIAALNNLSSAGAQAAAAAALTAYGAALETSVQAVPTVAENAAGLLDLSNGIETSLTLRQALRLMAAAAAGEVSGAATTTIVIRNAVADSKDRITATVDADGNRTAVVVDLT